MFKICPLRRNLQLSRRSCGIAGALALLLQIYPMCAIEYGLFRQKNEKIGKKKNQDHRHGILCSG